MNPKDFEDVVRSSKEYQQLVQDWQHSLAAPYNGVGHVHRAIPDQGAAGSDQHTPTSGRHRNLPQTFSKPYNGHNVSHSQSQAPVSSSSHNVVAAPRRTNQNNVAVTSQNSCYPTAPNMNLQNRDARTPQISSSHVPTMDLPQSHNTLTPQIQPNHVPTMGLPQSHNTLTPQIHPNHVPTMGLPQSHNTLTPQISSSHVPTMGLPQSHNTPTPQIHPGHVPTMGLPQSHNTLTPQMSSSHVPTTDLPQSHKTLTPQIHPNHVPTMGLPQSHNTLTPQIHPSHVPTMGTPQHFPFTGQDHLSNCPSSPRASTSNNYRFNGNPTNGTTQNNSILTNQMSSTRQIYQSFEDPRIRLLEQEFDKRQNLFTNKYMNKPRRCVFPMCTKKYKCIRMFITHLIADHDIVGRMPRYHSDIEYTVDAPINNAQFNYIREQPETRENRSRNNFNHDSGVTYMGHECKDCSGWFSDKTTFDKHKKAHGFQVPCPKCKKRLLQTNNQFKCSVCKTSFYIEMHLDGHKAVHDDTNGNGCFRLVALKDEEDRESNYILNNTASTSVNQVAISNDSGKKNTVCKRTFASKDYDNHIKNCPVCTELVNCTECGKYFRLYVLPDHILEHHTNKTKQSRNTDGTVEYGKENVRGTSLDQNATKGNASAEGSSIQNGILVDTDTVKNNVPMDEDNQDEYPDCSNNKQDDDPNNIQIASVHYGTQNFEVGENFEAAVLTGRNEVGKMDNCDIIIEYHDGINTEPAQSEENENECVDIKMEHISPSDTTVPFHAQNHA